MLDPLPTEKLRRTLVPEMIKCESSRDAGPLKSIIGQERAVRALQFGLGIKALGFNIYVAGLPGTGRTTAAKRFLEELAKDKPVPPDWCYVNNFRDAFRPTALHFPPGKAKQFREDMRNLIEEARREIRRVFESDQYIAKREETIRIFQQRRDQIIAGINARAQAEGFFIQATPAGLLLVPVKEGRPMQDEEFMALTPQDREEILRKREALQAELTAALRQARAQEKGATEALHKLDHQVALYALTPMIQELKEKYAELPAVLSYLDAVQQDILENLAQFRTEMEEQPAMPFPLPAAKDSLFKRYAVNVLVDNSDLQGAPVVIEFNPTYNDLFGRIEKEAQFGALVTDFTLIREGSLHRANGGFLVLPVEEVLRNPFAWDALKRAIRNKEIVIEEAGERLGLLSAKTLRPEPIPLDVKVILIGQPALYYLLYSLDEDFRELFKVKADFDSRMERTEETVKQYASYVCTVCEEGHLRHLDRFALAKIVEFGSRLAEDQEKLSTRFGELADIIREASYYAEQENAPLVTAAHVTKAIDERFYRSNLIQERVREMIVRGAIKIDIAGAQVGQVNGLSVVDLGDIAFGRPNRITCSIGMGQEGVIDIEREAKLAGPIHTKGVLILSGYLAQQYARDKPLSLSARLVFEQSYSGVEGDSASSAELYALLSALSGLPIKQSIAVTGSISQKGEVQAIGGVNEKIEGFFDVCKAKGLTGEQGVVIPESNVTNLMLREDVVEAVKEGRFHIWAVKTVDEGIEILTGVKAGERTADGTFEEGTVHALVDRRLRELSEELKRFGEKKEKEEEQKKEAEDEQ